jgi:imidazolonepropionase-like amidohydrolase
MKQISYFLLLPMIGACGLATAIDISRAHAAPPLAIKARVVHVGDGRTIAHAVVLVSGGRITAVGADLAVPDDAQVVEIDGGCLTPGLIDANARIESAEMIESSRRWSEDRASGAVDTEAGVDERSANEWDFHGADGDDTTVTYPLHFGEIGMRDGHVPDEETEHEDEGLPPLVSGVRSGVVVTEQSSEVVPQIRVLDGIDLTSGDFERLVRGGVTTVYASPDASAVIGARGAILHTAGPASDRVLVPAAAVKATIGSEPSRLGSYNRPPSRYGASVYMRRPNSRMGLVWVFRKAFYDVARRREGLPLYGADTADDEALDVLQQVVDGDVPLRIQARLQRDILAAIRLAEEFQLPFTLEEATEAYRCVDEIKAAGVPVIFGPIYSEPAGIRRSSGEGDQSRYFTFCALLEQGVPTALSAQEFREEDGLARQAMFAQRFGVRFDDALRAVTQTPAKLIGLDSELGTVTVGKRADLVLWSGEPFAATSKPLVVLVDGQIVVDQR